MSEVATIIADLVRAGVDPDLVGRTAAALASREPVVVKDEQAERRRASDRERKRLRNSAETADATAPSPPDGPPNAPRTPKTPPLYPPGSDAGASGALPVAAPAPVLDLEPVYTDDRHRLWGEAPAMLATLGIANGQARKLVGSWLKHAGDDCRTVLSAIQRARDHRPADPVPWITAAIRPRATDDRRNVHPLSRAFDNLDERIGAFRSG